MSVLFCRICDRVTLAGYFHQCPPRFPSRLEAGSPLEA